MKVHFIAIGGSAMHNLAISLYKKGYQVTGSDDEIFEPSKTRLENYGILPENIGWNPDRITPDIDAIILGMHARNDNSELIKARKLNLKIYSYPEYLFEQTKNKTRVVVGGSHGKTTITSMIMHVLKFHNMQFDYMVGAQIDGFETMASLTEDAPIAVFEGDEYLSSPLDPRPKFHLYQPHIALLSGIAWDHIREVVKQSHNLIEKTGYCAHSYTRRNNKTFLIDIDKEIPLQIFGEHNLQNISGAKLVCNQLGLSDDEFYQAITEFKGAAKRLELLAENEITKIFLDFAHSPSKLNATVNAVKEQFSDRKLLAVMELHTFSSLNADFLNEYAGSLDKADVGVVYFNPEVIKHKKLKPITKEQVKRSFQNENLIVHTSQKDLVNYIMSSDLTNKNLLLMSSGNFSGIDLKDFANKLVKI
jgi:UDP-N-acetylmuramate: L-alanyl-gamma-D-glutamyl-meso-diaminopimelate ligase